MTVGGEVDRVEELAGRVDVLELQVSELMRLVGGTPQPPAQTESIGDRLHKLEGERRP